MVSKENQVTVTYWGRSQCGERFDCNNCGRVVPRNATFCPNCGRVVNWEVIVDSPHFNDYPYGSGDCWKEDRDNRIAAAQEYWKRMNKQ